MTENLCSTYLTPTRHRQEIKSTPPPWFQCYWWGINMLPRHTQAWWASPVPLSAMSVSPNREIIDPLFSRSRWHPDFPIGLDWQGWGGSSSFIHLSSEAGSFLVPCYGKLNGRLSSVSHPVEAGGAGFSCQASRNVVQYQCEHPFSLVSKEIKQWNVRQS